MNALDIINHYKDIKYRANDRNFYPMYQTYPLIYPVKDQPDQICLDEGIPGGDFFVARLILVPETQTTGVRYELQRQLLPTKRWITISSEIILVQKPEPGPQE